MLRTFLDKTNRYHSFKFMYSLDENFMLATILAIYSPRCCKRETLKMLKFRKLIEQRSTKYQLSSTGDKLKKKINLVKA